MSGAGEGRLAFFQAPSWNRDHDQDPYSQEHCCYCGKPVVPGSYRLWLERSEDGEWWLVGPPARDATPPGRGRPTGVPFALPVGRNCLKRHPEWRFALGLPAAVDGPPRGCSHVVGIIAGLKYGGMDVEFQAGDNIRPRIISTIGEIHDVLVRIALWEAPGFKTPDEELREKIGWLDSCRRMLLGLDGPHFERPGFPGRFRVSFWAKSGYLVIDSCDLELWISAAPHWGTYHVQAHRKSSGVTYYEDDGRSPEDPRYLERVRGWIAQAMQKTAELSAPAPSC
jgi:hypothetical protein